MFDQYSAIDCGAQEIDIIMEVSLLLSHTTMPQEGHFDALLHVFSYLKQKHNSRMIFSPMYPDIDLRDFIKCDWWNFYDNVKEAVQPNAQEP